jgi:poly-gamma-glutamate synthesis protein (capsule biosynthesis protein)
MVINFFGDFVVNDSKRISLSSDIITMLKSADYNAVNFEAPIKDVTAPQKHKSGPSISQDENAPHWLKENYFNIISFANNHIFDYGEECFKLTKNKFGNEVLTVGAGFYEEAYKPVVLEKDGISVALFAMAELQFGVFSENKDGYGCAWINDLSVERRIREAKEKYNYVILIAHAGLECETIPLPEWRTVYRHMIDCGCDAVIGGHTHTAQGVELYKNAPIFYSLGNFCFEKNLSRNELWNIGGLASLTLRKNNLEWHYSLLKFCAGKVNLLDSLLSESKIDSLNKALIDSYQENINKICLRKLGDYNNLNAMAGYLPVDRNIIKSIARWLLGRCDDIHMLNTLQCETHRWCFERGLKIKNKLQ